jgi:DNA-binding NarL/FixJ family response regulator
MLLQVKPDLQAASVILTGNAHIDAAWLWPWTETVDVVHRTFGTALQLMDEYPQYTYTQSAAAYNQWMEEKYPFLHQQIAERVKEGRWEMVGGMWVEPDLNLPDGNGTELLRQIREANLPIKVAVTTGRTDRLLMAEVSQLQPDAFFTKPVDLRELICWIKSVA